ncbi:FAD-dependent oxidoreductase [Pollutimonas subterranea]|uniref:FAD-dependent oxidoreductase n=1 Tax=Pollutimonas subterranea TaxID=2045210 RepID=A0A2N4U411_9BURK|nr:NAD(P)/FAD-dependent oxidoreductase [Pollutimonas subterranea]PLC49751.1 FAD-dependent oxidoreductase [Pollutimonas subterranea]
MTSLISSSPDGLLALEQRLAQDLAWLDLPAKAWVPPGTVNGQRLLDVAIVGAGMAGLAAAAALANMGMVARVFDSAPEGFEGPWATTARMETLRSPKQLVGPALGLASLTFRAWFEAQFGTVAWNDLDKIPRLQWMEYLRWYRRAMKVDVRNDHVVTNIVPHADYVELHMQTPSAKQYVYARRVVLATGRAGLGGASIPDFVQAVSRDRWAHSSDPLDYSTLRGRRVGVVGAGASAMDSAGTALEHGAARVDVLIRRSDIPRINKAKGAGNPGFIQGYVDLPDDWKWRIRHYINIQQVPPPRASVLRVSQHANAHFHLGSPVLRVIDQGRALRVETPRQAFELDFLILSTGFMIDWHSRPEYATIAPHLRVWADRYTPTEGVNDRELLDSPDLGPSFEFQEKREGDLPGLSRIHCFCYPATLTHGTVSGDIPAISDGAVRLSQGIASLLYGENIQEHYAQLLAFDEPEVFGDEWHVAG